MTGPMQIHGIKSWFDRHEGVVVVEDDVQNVVRGIRELSDRLHVFYNPQTEGFDIVEKCLDSTDRLVFSVPELDMRVLDRLRRADHWHGQEVPSHVLGESEDFVAEVDAWNEKHQADKDAEGFERIREAGERLAWALDNTSDQHSVGGQILVPRSPDGSDDEG
jgi:hypothetical protein